MHQKKVLWVSHLLPWPPKGGVQQRSYYLARSVGEQHRLAFVSRYQVAHQASPGAVDAARRALSEFCETVDVDPSPIRPGAFQSAKLMAAAQVKGMPASVLWAASSTFGPRIAAVCRRFDPDIVHVDTVGLSQYRPFLPPSRLVLNHHNVESRMLVRRSEYMNRPLGWLARSEADRLLRYEQTEAPHYGLHLVCSELDRQRWLDVCGNCNVEVIPNGTDTEYFRPNVQPVGGGGSDVIFVGGLSWYPNASGVKYFIDSVWPLVRARHPTATFTVVGKSPPAWLLDYALTDSRVRPMGFVDDIRPLVEGAAVFVCPIFDGGGTKLKMLDAMSMARAIVAHPASCEGLNLKPGLHVCTATTAEEFATAVLELLGSSEKRMALGMSARRHVESQFSIAAIGRHLADLYSRI